MFGSWKADEHSVMNWGGQRGRNNRQNKTNVAKLRL